MKKTLKTLNLCFLKMLLSSVFNYPNISIELLPFIAKQVGGKIKLNEHADFKYLAKDELKSLDWNEADIPIVKKYLRL